MKHFAFTCQGESHKATDKPCQDYSYSSVENGVSIAIVCDGHGGDRYFRSDIGSRLCTEVTAAAIKSFISNIDNKIFIGQPLTKRKTVAEMETLKLNNTDLAMRQLFSSIIATWNQEIESYTAQHPLTEEEISKTQAKYIDEFQKGINLEKTYGCTLMAYVQTPKYWFAFHIGDGKCVSFHEENVLWQEPIEWDDNCFLNKTTSICDSYALNSFRYTYCGTGLFPVAVYLGSDGLDDTFGSIENLVDFYIQISKMLIKDGELKVQNDIRETFPLLSKKGSQDDMSLAFIYNENRLSYLIKKMLEFQITRIQNNIKSLEKSISDETEFYNSLISATSRKEIIEREYAKQKVFKLKDKLVIDSKKLTIRLEELKSLNKGNPSSMRLHFPHLKPKRIKIKGLKLLKSKKSL